MYLTSGVAREPSHEPGERQGRMKENGGGRKKGKKTALDFNIKNPNE